MTHDDPYTRPVAESAALVVIDMQRDFLDVPGAHGPMAIAGTHAVVPAIAKLATAFRQRGLPIVHVVRLYRPDGSNVDLVRRHSIEQGARVAVPGSPGSQIPAELLPQNADLDCELLLGGDLQHVGPSEHVLYKSRWGAFYDTKLDQHLREKGSSTVVFVGCNFPNCPRTSIYEASERDFRVVLVSDAVSGTYERGLDECRAIGVTVTDTSETLAWLAQ